ncbi:MAG TPA: hypothetical protein VH643_06070 [Gemmataceae bacterium]|jgi:hypothetical protein
MSRSILLESGPLTFRRGVPVGGWANVALYPDGYFSFSGHFHNSGAPRYGVSVIVWIRSKTGRVFTFGNSGKMGGLTGGSRDWNFGINKSNASIKTAWKDLSAGWSGQCHARVGVDLAGLWGDVKSTAQAVGPVVAVVGALL